MPDARERYLLRVYGITKKQYEQLLVKQNGGCAICRKTIAEEGRNLAVDHDHKTREIFGLLCYRCNHRLVGRNRDPWLFAAASVYLRKGTGWFVPEKKKKHRHKKRRS